MTFLVLIIGLIAAIIAREDLIAIGTLALAIILLLLRLNGVEYLLKQEGIWHKDGKS